MRGIFRRTCGSVAGGGVPGGAAAAAASASSLVFWRSSPPTARLPRRPVYDGGSSAARAGKGLWCVTSPPPHAAGRPWQARRCLPAPCHLATSWPPRTAPPHPPAMCRALLSPLSILLGARPLDMRSVTTSATPRAAAAAVAAAWHVAGHHRPRHSTRHTCHTAKKHKVMQPQAFQAPPL